MEEEVSNNGGPWHARMNSHAPGKKKEEEELHWLTSSSIAR